MVVRVVAADCRRHGRCRATRSLGSQMSPLVTTREAPISTVTDTVYPRRCDPVNRPGFRASIAHFRHRLTGIRFSSRHIWKNRFVRHVGDPPAIGRERRVRLAELLLQQEGRCLVVVKRQHAEIGPGDPLLEHQNGPVRREGVRARLRIDLLLRLRASPTSLHDGPTRSRMQERGAGREPCSGTSLAVIVHVVAPVPAACRSHGRRESPPHH